MTAGEKVQEFRRRLAEIRLENNDRPPRSMIYHAEPWDVACNLADEQLPISHYKSQYEAVLLRNGLKPGRTSRSRRLTVSARSKDTILAT